MLRVLFSFVVLHFLAILSSFEELQSLYLYQIPSFLEEKWLWPWPIDFSKFLLELLMAFMFSWGCCLKAVAFEGCSIVLFPLFCFLLVCSVSNILFTIELALPSGTIFDYNSFFELLEPLLHVDLTVDSFSFWELPLDFAIVKI